MARSVWKGPFVDAYVLKKAEASRESGRNEEIKIWSRRSTILPQFVGREMVDTVLSEGRRFYTGDQATIPVEFQAAAYRFGHSMVRPSYRANLAGVGHDAFVASCSACHGAAGEGVAGLGKALAGSPFVREKTDAELMTFVKTGRPIWDPENTTGIDMPAKGGNPALTDDDLFAIVAYIRSLNQ